MSAQAFDLGTLPSLPQVQHDGAAGFEAQQRVAALQSSVVCFHIGSLALPQGVIGYVKTIDRMGYVNKYKANSQRTV